MSKRHATAQWKGTLKEGAGTFSVESKAIKGAYTFETRFGSAKGTNPEELVAAAHAACYSMFLSALLSGQKLDPKSIDTRATVTLDKDAVGPKITEIHLDCNVKVKGISKTEFLKLAKKAKANCPISRLYKGTKITLTAALV